MNKLHYNKYYNHSLIKYVKHKSCNEIDSTGKKKIYIHNKFIFNIGCLLKNKIKFIFDETGLGIKKINSYFVSQLFSLNKNMEIFLNKDMIYNLKIAEILNIKYISQSKNTYIIFYDINKLNSIYFLFIRPKLKNIIKTTRIKYRDSYKFFYGYLNNYSDLYIKKLIKSNYIMQIPKHLGYNKWLKKKYKSTEIFSYKKDYNRRHEFIFSKQNEKYFDNKYENIKKNLMKMYNDTISSSEFDTFYKEQLKNIKDYKFFKKDIIKYLNNENIKKFNKYLSDLDVEVKKLN